MTSNVSSISEGDFLASEFFRNFYPSDHKLLTDAPVTWSEKVGGWLVSPFEDVQLGLQSSSFRSGGRIDCAAKVLSPEVRQKNMAALDCINAMMSFRDAPDHTRLRRLVSKAFTPRRIAALEPQIQDMVDQLLDQWPNDEVFDLVETFSFKLPAMVICRLLGIPLDRLDDINQWAEGIVNLLSAGVITPSAALGAKLAVVEASNYLDSLIETKLLEPTDDLLSALVALEDESDALSRAELIEMVIQLFFAGFETTEGLIGNALNILLQQREQFLEMAGNPELAALTTEEALRFDNSIHRQTRVASEDVVIQGMEIPKSDYVFFMIGAANRDFRRFQNPDVFNPNCSDLGSVAFGLGVHFCLGAPLARLETKVAIRSISERFPSLRITQGPSYGKLLAIRKPVQMLLSIA